VVTINANPTNSSPLRRKKELKGCSFAFRAWNESLRVRLNLSGSRKVTAMRTFFIVLLIWVTPSFLFVGWRLFWMSRPIRDVHYRDRWEYSHALEEQGS
jgi:hypothetical protein